MKATKLAITFIGASILCACSSTANEPQAATPEAKQSVAKSWCTFDDGQTEAPEFFCTGAIDNFAATGRGSSPKSESGMNFMVQQAALAARVELAQSVRTQVGNMVKNYLGTTGVADGETIDAVATSTSKAITDESLIGSRIVRRVIGPQGEVYVWVAIDEKNLVADAQKAIRTSMANDEAAWQKFQAGKSYEEMAQDIADLRVMKSQ